MMRMSVHFDSGWKGLVLVMGSRVTGVTFHGVDDSDGDEDDAGDDDEDDEDDAGDDDEDEDEDDNR